MIVFIILLLDYIIILGGNSMIILVASTDPKLHSPMYFFLYHLAFVDIVYTTTNIPKMLSGFLIDVNTISVPGCFLQRQFVIQLSVTEYAILTVMAYDRYVAICHPLRYTAIMTRTVRLLLIVGAWGFGSFCSLPSTFLTWQRTYCGPNVITHAWCDPSSVRRLVCGDTKIDNFVSISFAIVALLTTGVLILTSYILIGISISRMGVAQRLKAFGTCAAHLTVVSTSYSMTSFVYISYRVGNFSSEVRNSYPPLSTNHRASVVNGTLESDGVTFFIIEGLAGLGEKKMIVFIILLLGYIIILGGNSMIILVVQNKAFY
ncbi:olfactory receptor 10J4-like [Etheostoma cragini]|uniref:olfactory receptor 10J4-like n=1 Tax=Etheostoma cragini TaxID=417921 RepID=UPI00155EF9B3|nr:olfactory receptor 10J4-like [Etheostoma cragini]